MRVRLFFGNESGPVTHSTTGALTGPGSVVAGSAARSGSATTHDTSGALVGPGSTVAGSAARIRIHSSIGVLIGQGAVVAGSASKPSAPVTQPITDTHDGFLPRRIKSKVHRKKFERLWEDLIELYEQLSGEAIAEVPMAKPVVADYVKPAPVVAAAKPNPPPEIDWNALNRDMTRLYMLIEQNRRLIEDQDEEEAMLLLM